MTDRERAVRASEKLRALADEERDYDLWHALPQIVAVVEAAERMPALRYSNAQPSLSASWSAKDLRAALAALTEALS